jgi:hypothetical protein
VKDTGYQAASSKMCASHLKTATVSRAGDLASAHDVKDTGYQAASSKMRASHLKTATVSRAGDLASAYDVKDTGYQAASSKMRASQLKTDRVSLGSCLIPYSKENWSHRHFNLFTVSCFPSNYHFSFSGFCDATEQWVYKTCLLEPTK